MPDRMCTCVREIEDKLEKARDALEADGKVRSVGTVRVDRV